jgi:small subunit ribosomal protein S9
MNKVIVMSGKRKRAIARATIRPGKGSVKVNSVPIDFVMPKISRMKIEEPIMIAGEAVNGMSIDIDVKGGGINSQAEAARLAVAKGIVAYTKDSKLKKEFITYDRNLLVADVRRKESAKPNRHSQARSKTQKSYR